MPFKVTNYQYLLAKLAKVSSDDLSAHWSRYQCLIWERGTDRAGFGALNVNWNVGLKAHREAFALVKGTIPDGARVIQYCGNRRCFRPAHLFSVRNNLDFLQATILALADDLSIRWSEYPCLLWERGAFPQGYGAIHVDGTSRHVHVVAYELAVGPVPVGKEVCHRCDIRLCYRPIHLFAGTHIENMEDMMAKGRGNKAYGERAAGAKMSESEAREAIDMLNAGMTQIAIAARFGVTNGAISHIVNGRSWRSLRHLLKETK